MCQNSMLSIKICRQLIADWDARQFPRQGSELAISCSHLGEFINAHKLTDRCRSNNEVPRLIFSTFTEEKTRRRSCLPPITENHKKFLCSPGCRYVPLFSSDYFYRLLHIACWFNCPHTPIYRLIGRLCSQRCFNISYWMFCSSARGVLQSILDSREQGAKSIRARQMRSWDLQSV